MDVLRFHEISESSHLIMNPLSSSKLDLLGEICGLDPRSRVLDLACGKGALLAGFAERWGSCGVGVDIHPAFLQAAREHAETLGVSDKVSFVEADASNTDAVEGVFEVVSCLGASWIGGGATGTLTLMSRWLAPGGYLLFGECYWMDRPSQATIERHVVVGEGFADLVGTLGRFENLGLDLVEMVLASPDDWDRYSASQWLNVSKWLASHSSDPDAPEVRQIRDASRRGYLEEDRRCLGWGVFVLGELAPSDCS